MRYTVYWWNSVTEQWLVRSEHMWRWSARSAVSKLLFHPMGDGDYRIHDSSHGHTEEFSRYTIKFGYADAPPKAYRSE